MTLSFCIARNENTRGGVNCNSSHEPERFPSLVMRDVLTKFSEVVRDLGILFVHLLATIARLFGPGGARSVAANPCS